jgi:hypothetical protein
MMRRHDARTLRRLLSGEAVNGESEAVSEEFRAIVERLASLDPQSALRELALDSFLDGRADRDEIVKAVAGADGPSPDTEAPDDAEEWPACTLGEMPPAEPFPVDVFPEAVAEFAGVVADSVGCLVDYVGLPLLVVAGAAIGRSVSLLLKPGYFAPASLYGMNVGGASARKSPGCDEAVRPLWTIDEALHDAYRARKAEYDAAEEAYRRAKDDCLPRPVKPIIESAIMEDASVEAVACHLSRNPGGSW